MSGLTRDEIAEPVSLGQMSTRELGQGKFIFHVELTTIRINKQQC